MTDRLPFTSGTSLASRMPCSGQTGVGTHQSELLLTADTGKHIVLAHGHIVGEHGLQALADADPDRQRFLIEASDLQIDEWVQSIRNGRFNIVRHDVLEQSTTIWSDRGGFLPLYVGMVGGQLLCASNYQAAEVLSPEPLILDDLALAGLYRFGYPIGLRGLYQGLSLPPPGCRTVISWQHPDPQVTVLVPRHSRRQNKALTLGQCAEEVHRLMDQACQRLTVKSAPYAIKLSGGMDSRLIASALAIPDVRSYTWGDRGSTEMEYARRLAASCGFSHHELLIDGSFHEPYPQMHEHHGLMEFFHELAAVQMRADQRRYNFDGMLGDIFFGGLGLNRINRGDQVRAALGIAPGELPVPGNLDEVVDKIYRDISVPCTHFDVLDGSLSERFDHLQDDLRHAIYHELVQSSDHETLDGAVLQFKLYNRSRRYIALQNATTRDQCETLFPFLDADLWEFAEEIPFSVLANKRLYIALYSRFYPRHRSVPAIMSGLPFSTRPEHAHYAGRIARALKERAGEQLARRGLERARPRTHEATQWNRWFNSNAVFREWIGSILRDSPWIDDHKFEQLMQTASSGRARIHGTKMMLTLSTIAWERRTR